MKRELLDRVRGCFLAGAMGDALGYPVEFYTLARIYNQYGKKGITDLEINKQFKKSIITDDTQMLLFTAEGLINYSKHDRKKEILLSYHRWLYTQTKDYHVSSMEAYKNLDAKKLERKFFESKLLKDDRLYNLRAPGNTCINSLTYGRFQNFKKNYNFSKGCGGVMRVAPVGFFHSNPYKAFVLGCETAVLTHAHALGYLSSGYFASLISYLNSGYKLIDAIRGSLSLLSFNWDITDLTEYEISAMNFFQTQDVSLLIELIRKATKLAHFALRNNTDKVVNIGILGHGFVAEEAVAIAIYCALVYENSIKDALILSVNHDGDSDSTGSMCGNIMGTIHGSSTLPKDWLSKLELVTTIDYMSKALTKCVLDREVLRV